jgi:hypothetical protein
MVDVDHVALLVAAGVTLSIAGSAALVATVMALWGRR